MITMYGSPGCHNCVVLKNEYDDDGVEYEYIDVNTLTSDELKALVALNDGSTALPILVNK
jgi:glutaredoxin